MDIQERVFTVLERALKLDAQKLTPETSREDCEPWDSLGHIVLMEELEKEFSIQISGVDALSIQSISDVVSLVKQLTEDS